MKKIFSILVLFLVLTSSSATHAQAYESERIVNFGSQILITKDNKAKITETIEYNFGSQEKHGIFREVPTRTITNDADKYYYYQIEWGEITQDGQPAKFVIEEDEDRSSAKIGDANKTITGVHTYQISYTLSPVIENDPAGDYFNFDVTGNDWKVPIDYVDVTLELENGVPIKTARCYTGPVGSREQDCDDTATENKLSVFTTNLNSYEGLTINVLTEGSHYSSYLTTQAPPPPDYRVFVPLLAGIGTLLFGLALRTKRYINHKGRQNDQTIVPQYEPPKDLSIGELGTLHDNAADMKEITGTLIDLAVKHVIKITQVQQKSLFKAAEYQFDLLKHSNKLASHEQSLLDLLFANGLDSINLKDVSKTEAGKTVPAVKKSFVTSLETKGFRHQSSKLASQKHLNKIFGWTCIAIVIWGIYCLIAISGSVPEKEALIPLSIAGLVVTVIGYAISTTIHITDTGYKKWAEVEGLIMYLTVAEKDRLAFHNAPDKSPEHFSELLPAAIALGVDKEWANQFKDLDISSSVDWYNGQSGSLNSVMLANSLSTGLNSTVASSFTPPSQSSSGFSGGGSSGGGGGGGGGGSW